MHGLGLDPAFFGHRQQLMIPAEGNHKQSKKALGISQ
jgi:hypothetical protein